MSAIKTAPVGHLNGTRSSRVHLFSLDAVRGLGALAVVLWHWQHFLWPSGRVYEYAVERQPFFLILKPFYTHGFLAVELFFVLSGFVFYWLYSRDIAEGLASPRRFFVLRFSRLYPLHFITLLGVAVCQWIYVTMCGTPFIYRFNGPTEFIAQLFFCSYWVPSAGESFNGPVWSVSAEVLVYAAFFAVCRAKFTNALAVGGISVICFLLQPLAGSFAALALLFFVGGLCYFLWRALREARFLVQMLTLSVLWILGLGVGIDWGAGGVNGLYFAYRELFPTQILFRKDVVGSVLLLIPRYLPVFVALITTLAVVESKSSVSFTWAAPLGAISYSSYLLHFPLQLATVLVVKSLGISDEIFYTRWFLLTFFSLLIVLSLWTYTRFELPAQRFLRVRLLSDTGSREP